MALLVWTIIQTFYSFLAKVLTIPEYYYFFKSLSFLNVLFLLKLYLLIFFIKNFLQSNTHTYFKSLLVLLTLLNLISFNNVNNIFLVLTILIELVSLLLLLFCLLNFENKLVVKSNFITCTIVLFSLLVYYPTKSYYNYHINYYGQLTNITTQFLPTVFITIDSILFFIILIFITTTTVYLLLILLVSTKLNLNLKKNVFFLNLNFFVNFSSELLFFEKNSLLFKWN